MERTGKFHLDDAAQRTGLCYMSVLSDPDDFFRPWRFANRAVMPSTVVLFPRVEGAIRRFKAVRSETAYRARTVLAAARGQITDWE